MRSPVLLALLLPTLWVTNAEAFPFMPDEISITTLHVRFVETGTDTVCLRCDDADASNDFRVTIDGFDGAAWRYRRHVR